VAWRSWEREIWADMASMGTKGAQLTPSCAVLSVRGSW
jgi:hypothetical protein